MSRPWGRLYAGTRNHRKIRILAERLPSLWCRWYVLIEMAIEVDDGGWIYVAPDIPYTFKELAKELRIRREDHVKTLCRTLEELNLITITDKGILLNSFSERNFESDWSTPRTRKYKEKQKADRDAGTFRERSGNDEGNVPGTDQNRTDTEQSTPNPAKRGRLRAVGKNPRTKRTNPRAKGTNPRAKAKGDNGYDPDFETWWQDYPERRKTGKPKVYQKWQALKKIKKLLPLDGMLAVLRAQKQSPDWTKDGGDFIPGLHPYLNQFKFLDESIMAPFRADPNCPVCRGKGREFYVEDGENLVRDCQCLRRMHGNSA